MPYEVKPKDNEFCVFKEGSIEPMKCYPTEQEAMGYMRALYAAEPDMKMGARNNEEDRKRIQMIRESAKAIHDLTCELDPEEDPLLKSVKTDGFVLSEFNIMDATVIKASGDMELEVLLVPFGGPLKGKDTDGQYFDSETKTQHEIYKTIPAYYYHGFDPKGRPQGEPEIIGMMHYDHMDEQGHWYKCVLDKKNEYAKRIWQAAKDGKAKASSGSISHIVRDEKNGHITLWPVVEGSLIDEGEKRHPANAYAVALPVLKAKYDKLQLSIDELPEADKAADKTDNQNLSRSIKMAEQDEIKTAVAEALKAQNEANAAKAAQEAEKQAAIDAAVKAKTEELEKQFAAENRLPGGVYVKKFADTDKFDNLDAADTAVMIGVCKSAGKPVSVGALKALSLKLSEDKTEVGREGQKAMKAVGLKAGEIDYSTSAGYGDEWVGISYSTALWNSIRLGTFLVNKIPSVEVPQGSESINLPLEGADPTWYNVAQNTTNGSTVGTPAPTITSSRVATDRQLLTLAKLGARVVWTGEMDEDSLIPFASQLRTQLALSGAEAVESAIIDGDTAATTANVNATDGAGCTGVEWYSVFDGMRKSALITTAANSRSAAGSLDVTDYLETIKLMGASGTNAVDVNKVEFIIGAATHFKTLALPELTTKDVSSSPTIEGGRLTGLWGYKINLSGAMCKNSAKRLTTSAGDISLTDTNNLYGQILAVRYDQWKLGWKRRMTMETTRFANSDSNEIVAMIRLGLKQRDTEASAVTYYVGV